MRVRHDEHVIGLSPPSIDLSSRGRHRAPFRLDDAFWLVIVIAFASAAATIALIVFAGVITLLRHALLSSA